MKVSDINVGGVQFVSEKIQEVVEKKQNYFGLNHCKMIIPLRISRFTAIPLSSMENRKSIQLFMTSREEKSIGDSAHDLDRIIKDISEMTYNLEDEKEPPAI